MLATGQSADISEKAMYGGDFDLALRSIMARACIMPGSTDLFCRAEDNEYEAARMPNAVCRKIVSDWGHFAGRGINQEDHAFIDGQLKRLWEPQSV